VSEIRNQHLAFWHELPRRLITSSAASRSTLRGIKRTEKARLLEAQPLKTKRTQTMKAIEPFDDST